MNRVTGTYRNGKVVLDQRVDWLDGMPVEVVCESATQIGAEREGVDICVDGSAWEETPEAVQRWVEWFDSLEPALTGREMEAFEADLRSARDEQKALLRSWQERIDNRLK